MSATVHRLPTAAATPVMQARDRRLLRMAELIAARAQARGVDCTVEDAISAVRASVAIEMAQRGNL